MKLLNKLCLFFIIPFNVLAYSDYIYASGANIGIELKSDGVNVVGLYKVGDIYPAMEAGIQVGDKIISINDNSVGTINEMINKIQENLNGEVKIGYLRNNIAQYTNLKLYKESGIYKTGLYVKDSINGIGTLTYIDPFSNTFGALGHEITDSGGIKLETMKGSIYDSIVTGVAKSREGIPGGKNAKTNEQIILGDIKENTIHGIFGKYTNDIINSKLYRVVKPNEIKKGDAKILTVLSDHTVEEFNIKILKLSNLSTTKNILFEVTDQSLLDKTGGIVQGMSGSPIIQGDNIIGAVTHVVIDSPTKGYGIFITNMLEEGEN